MHKLVTIVGIVVGVMAIVPIVQAEHSKLIQGHLNKGIGFGQKMIAALDQEEIQLSNQLGNEFLTHIDAALLELPQRDSLHQDAKQAIQNAISKLGLAIQNSFMGDFESAGERVQDAISETKKAIEIAKQFKEPKEVFEF